MQLTVFYLLHVISRLESCTIFICCCVLCLSASKGTRQIGTCMPGYIIIQIYGSFVWSGPSPLTASGQITRCQSNHRRPFHDVNALWKLTG